MSANKYINDKEKFHFLGFDTGAGGIDTKVEGVFPIQVSETITAEQKKYLTSLIVHDALEATFNINSIVVSPLQASYKKGIIPLKGVTVTDLTLVWAFTQGGVSVDVAQQVNSVPVTPNTVKSLNRTGLTLVYTDTLQARTNTLFGDDGLNLAGSTVTKTAVLGFGNRIWYGEGVLENDDNLLRTLLTSLSEDIRLDPSITVSPTSLAGDVFVYIAVPTDIATGIVFQDLSSPVDTDPMKVHKSSFSLTNGIMTDTYTVYISKQSALRGSVITPKTWQ